MGSLAGSAGRGSKARPVADPAFPKHAGTPVFRTVSNTFLLFVKDSGCGILLLPEPKQSKKS